MPNILIVEDSPTQAEELKALLEKRRYEVSVAGDGRQALIALRREVPDVVVTDIVMPEMDGFQLCSNIKTDPGLRDVPVVILTSLADPIDVIRGLECGANCFLTKPYQEEELYSRLQHVLLNRELRRAHGAEMAIEFVFMGKKYRITSDRMQILDLLITTYETAVEKNRELVRVQGELRDLNQRLEEEVQLRTASLRLEMAERQRSEQRYRELFDSSVDGIVIADIETRALRHANPAMCQMLGYTEAELRALRVDDIHPKDALALVIAEFQAIARREKTIASNIPCLRKDGTIVHADVSANVATIDGRVCNVGLFRNVTERNLLQKQFLQAQKMEAVGQLAGGIAHDFNNLITAITGYSELVLRSLGPEDPNRPDIEQIKKAGQRAAALTRQLLAFSRKQVVQPAVLDLNVVVADLYKMLVRLLGENIQLTFIPGPGLGLLKADPGQIEQVLVNLAVNARDAMPDGGKLTIETTDVVLDEEYARTHAEARSGPYVMLAVTDTGNGMDAETRARIFEPFFTTKGPGKGTGLGLSTVYGIVKQSLGHVSVYSELGKGTTFKVYLPRVEGAIAEAAGAEQPAGSLRGTETILLAEDEETIRNLAARILRENGYAVIGACNGEEALRLAAAAPGPVDLVLTDVVMPEMSGRELVVRLASVRSGIKSLFMSGYTADSVILHGVLEQTSAFVPKPFTRDALLRKVRAVLDSK